MTHDSDSDSDNGPATDDLSAKLAEWEALANEFTSRPNPLFVEDAYRLFGWWKRAREAIPALIAMVRERNATIGQRVDAEKIADIRAREQTASPAPWTYLPPELYEPEADDPETDPLNGSYIYPGGVENAEGDPVCEFGTRAGSGSMFENKNDHLFVAHARQDVRDLLAALDAAEERATAAEARVKELQATIEELDFLRHEGGSDSVSALEQENARLKAEIKRRDDAPDRPA